jgi:drug/metabolite transporter (DMT)-like permease
MVALKKTRIDKGGLKMAAIAMVLVLGSGFVHSVWNLFTKKSIDKNVFLWLCQWVAILAFLPWAILDIGHLRNQSIAYLCLFASMFLHGLYVVLLAKTYTVGDLSLAYPIMRGTSPLLVPIVGTLFLNESLSGRGWISLGFILLGIVLLSGKEWSKKANQSLKAVPLALGVGTCIAAYIIVDKLTLNYMSPVLLNMATNVGNMLALSWVIMKPNELKREWIANWKTILLGGILAPGGYLLFLFALSLAEVAQLAPMREIATVFGTVLGILVLHERQGLRRVAASVIITLGVIALGVWG